MTDFVGACDWWMIPPPSFPLVSPPFPPRFLSFLILGFRPSNGGVKNVFRSRRNIAVIRVQPFCRIPFIKRRIFIVHRGSSVVASRGIIPVLDSYCAAEWECVRVLVNPRNIEAQCTGSVQLQTSQSSINRTQNIVCCGIKGVYSMDTSRFITD